MTSCSAWRRRDQLRAQQEAQVRRMLKDPKARALTENFAEQWLYLGGLKKVGSRSEAVSGFRRTLRQDMREETRQFVSARDRRKTAASWSFSTRITRFSTSGSRGITASKA